MEEYKSFLRTNLEGYLNILQDMVMINSFTYSAEGVNKLGQYTATLFEKLGFKSSFHQSINLKFGKHLFLIKEATTRSRTKPAQTIACISHLDTVFSAEEEIRNVFHWRREGDRIYGPGTVDIKGGTLMIYMLMDALRTYRRDLFEQINWYVMLDACEEALSHDFGESVHRLLTGEVIGCLVFEGGTVNNSDVSLVTSRKGRATFDIKVKGRSAHAGNAHQQGANAIVELAHVIIRASEITDYDNDLTVNIGKVSGGSVVNRVPHEATAQAEMRAFSPDILYQAIEQILNLNNSPGLNKKNQFSCETIIKTTDKMTPWPPNQSTEKLYKVWKAAGKELDVNVKQEARGGLSDGNYLSYYYPTIDGLGPSGANAHCSEHIPDIGKEQEYVVISSFVKKGLINLSALLKLCSEDAKTY